MAGTYLYINLKVLIFILLCFECSWQDDIESDIDEFVEQVMSCGNIPGLALTLVKDGEDLYSKGYGVMDIESQKPVTNKTLFVINSCTKAFAGVSLAILIKQNPSIGWLMPVKQILGESFYLNDTVRTELVNTVDTFAHRCGTAYNNEMRLSGYSLPELVKRLQYLEYPHDFRDGYNYNNIMYGIPSLIAELMTDKPWTTFVSEEIFQPLNMSASTFITNTDAWPFIALSHRPDPENGNQLRRVSLEVAYAYYKIAPAIGGIASNAIDMSKWLKFQLNKGTTEGGTEVLTEAEFWETVRSRVDVSGEPMYQKPQFPVMYNAPSRYALGWKLSSYRDYVMRHHTGNAASFNSHVSYLPNAGHGIFITMNKDPVGNIRDLLAMYFYDLLLGIEPWLSKDTVCDYIVEDGNQRQWKTGKGCITKEECLPSGDFTGRYGHHAYGNITINEEMETGSLSLTYGLDEWIWDLVQDDIDPTVFHATGREPFWYFTMDVDFEREAEGIPAQSVMVGFDEDIPPRFDRDLDFNNPPSPPPH